MPGAKSAGTLTGVAIGARIGMLAGPAGLIAGAVVGGLVADNYMPKNSQCPCCDEVIPLD